MPGPPPADPALRLIRGSRAPKAKPAAPRVGELPLDVPAELTDTVAAAEWQRTIVPAIEAGIITAADRAMAIAHCDLWAVWRSQLAEAARSPHVIFVGPNKHPTPNPARGMANVTAKLLRGVDGALGLSPTARARVTPQRPPQRPNAVDQFMNRKSPRE